MSHEKQGFSRVLTAKIVIHIDKRVLRSHGLTIPDVYRDLDQFLQARKVFSIDDIKNFSLIPLDSETPIRFGDVASVRVILGAKEDDLAERGTDSAPQEKEGRLTLTARIEVDTNHADLASHGLSIGDVSNALDQFIQAQKVFSIDDIKNISILPPHSEIPIKFGDVASVRITFAEKAEMEMTMKEVR
jgi:Cu/Ag efflux pump CusA